MSDDGLEQESGAADRLIFFSDAVVAIAITLLALDLPVPTGHTTQEFWGSVRDSSNDYLSFIISFIVIAAMWAQHHHVFRYLERSDSRMRTLNMAWLLVVILIPFATRLVTNERDDDLTLRAIQWSFYALLEVFAAATFVIMVKHMISYHLQAVGTPPELADTTIRRSYSTMAGFGLSIPVFFLTTYAWALWIVIPILIRQYHRRRRMAATRS